MSLPPIGNIDGNGDQNNNLPAFADQPMFPANMPQSQTNNANDAHQQIGAPSMADDVDLIEKEWVSKIKEIIQKTKNDPYERSRQLTLLKTEYLQKRYNKNIKVT